MPKRKKILVHSNSHFAFTGFGKNCKNILKHLQSTGKYDLYELANGVVWSDNENSYPWGFYGSLPNDHGILSQLRSNPQLQRMASYGLLTVDKAILTIKPDVYLGIEDIWAFNETVKKPWWNKINCMIWTTLDSLPILPDAISMAPLIKNYYVWSGFAEKAMREIGVDHVKTLHGSIDESSFFRLSDSERSKLRSKFKIDDSAFIIGYVFRNQLRKTVSDLIIGFRMFKHEFPESNAKLLLHTNWAEGWDIPRLISENKLNPNDILATYHCPKCKNYAVSPFGGNKAICPYCGNKENFSTVSVVNGVSENQLNEIYNLMDMYVHPFTSGGQEIPIQEAKLTELITAVTNYACGEEMCGAISGGLPLSWSPYREFGTLFVKASTSPLDIKKKIELVYRMPIEERMENGKLARKYIINNYSFSAVGKRLEEILDAMPEVSYSYDFDKLKPNPEYPPRDKYSSDVEFVKDLFLNMLGQEKQESDPLFISVVNKIRSGEKPSSIYKSFKAEAVKKLSLTHPPKIDDFIDKESQNPRIALVIPSDIYAATLCGSFIPAIKNKFPDHDLYVFADKGLHYIFFEYSDYLKKIAPIVPNCDNISHMEGIGDHEGFFDVCYILDKQALNLCNYSHNVKDHY